MGNSKFNGQLQLDRMDVMYRAMGVAQHHDAVAGTEKQHVAGIFFLLFFYFYFIIIFIL